MRGIDGPMSGYNGNVYTVAAALESNRLNVDVYKRQPINYSLLTIH